MHPLRTVGIALHNAAWDYDQRMLHGQEPAQPRTTKVIKIASVADKPVVNTADAADQPAAVTRSENQYQVKLQPVHVLFS